jgi:hypothetical protein
MIALLSRFLQVTTTTCDGSVHVGAACSATAGRRCVFFANEKRRPKTFAFLESKLYEPYVAFHHGHHPLYHVGSEIPGISSNIFHEEYKIQRRKAVGERGPNAMNVSERATVCNHGRFTHNRVGSPSFNAAIVVETDTIGKNNDLVLWVGGVSH